MAFFMSDMLSDVYSICIPSILNTLRNRSLLKLLYSICIPSILNTLRNRSLLKLFSGDHVEHKNDEMVVDCNVTKVLF